MGVGSFHVYILCGWFGHITAQQEPVGGLKGICGVWYRLVRSGGARGVNLVVTCRNQLPSILNYRMTFEECFKVV
jgi:hypothetical protein